MGETRSRGTHLHDIATSGTAVLGCLVCSHIFPVAGFVAGKSKPFLVTSPSARQHSLDENQVQYRASHEIFCCSAVVIRSTP